MRLTPAQRELAIGAIQLAQSRASYFAHIWHQDIEECRDSCVDALVRCAGTFDPSRGVRFSTYLRAACRMACRCIVARMRRPSREFRDRMRVLQDPMRDRRVQHPADRMIAAECMQLLTILEDRERKVVWWRIIDGELMPEIGRRIGVSKERVRQIVEKSLAKMRGANGVSA